VTTAIEAMRREKSVGSSLQTYAVISPAGRELLDDAQGWADICITSDAEFGAADAAMAAPGQKCERCWRVLPEVGTQPHPTLCIRCCEAVA
jgi:isoleucyl-tRNA synthetase